jgi:hypothetical protein
MGQVRLHVLRQGAEEYKAAAKGFSVEHERTIMQGKEEWKIAVFSMQTRYIYK